MSDEVADSPEGLAQLGAGVPDQFRRLWTPHRLAYIKGEKDDSCPFCVVPTLSDEDGLVVRRGVHAFAVLNLYPYTAGHLMVVPYRHVADYDELTAEEAAEVASLTAQSLKALRHATAAQGFNLGMNLGSVAGAGIAAHLHQHVVPRWAETPTSCRWWATRECCRSCSARPVTSSLSPGLPARQASRV